MFIREAAAAVGVSTDTLRRWEREGLIPAPARDQNGNRIYTPADLEVMRRVKAGSADRRRAKCSLAQSERLALAKRARTIQPVTGRVLRERVAAVLEAVGTGADDWTFLMAYYRAYHHTTNMTLLAAQGAPTPETLGRRRREVLAYRG